MPLGAIANAELQAEVDAEADKQHREINRYQIERADHQQAERRGDGEPDDEATNTAKMIRTQRSASHRMMSTMAIVTVALSAAFSLMRGEFLVGHRHRAGQPQARLIFRREIEIGGGLANGVGGFFAGLEFRKVERGLDERKRRSSSASRRWPWTSSCQEKLAGLPAFTFSMVSAASVIGHVMLSSVISPPCTPSRPNCSTCITPRKRRVAGQDLHQPLRLGEQFHLRREIVGRFEQQTVLRKEAAAFRLDDGVKQILLLGQPLHQRVGCRLDQFRRRRVDHRDDQFELRKRLFECGLALAPRQVEEMSWLTSVVMRKCVAAYQDDRTASRTDTPITGQAYCAQKPIARTTRAVMVFMGWSAE